MMHVIISLQPVHIGALDHYYVILDLIHVYLDLMCVPWLKASASYITCCGQLLHHLIHVDNVWEGWASSVYLKYTRQ